MPAFVVEILTDNMNELALKQPSPKGEIKRTNKTANGSRNAKTKKSSTSNKKTKNAVMPRNNVDVTSKILPNASSGEVKVLTEPKKIKTNTLIKSENCGNDTANNNPETGSTMQQKQPISQHEEAKQFLKNFGRQRRTSVEILAIEDDFDNDGEVVGFLKMSPLQVEKPNMTELEKAPIPFKLKKSKSDSKLPAKSKRTTSNTKASVNQKKSKPTQSHQITDFYPVRRSNRKTKTQVKKQIENEMIDAVLNDCEDGLDIVDLKDKGRGIVATKEFRASSFVVEYAGDLINWKDAKKREQEYAANPNIGCYMYYFNSDDVNYCIDATAESGRKGRLLNHSRKNPNCKTKLIKVPSSNGQVLPKLVLIAARDIKVGEELTYDYGDRDKQSLETHPWLKS